MEGNKMNMLQQLREAKSNPQTLSNLFSEHACKDRCLQTKGTLLLSKVEQLAFSPLVECERFSFAFSNVKPVVGLAHDQIVIKNADGVKVLVVTPYSEEAMPELFHKTVVTSAQGEVLAVGSWKEVSKSFFKVV